MKIGAGLRTAARYRAVFDKFLAYATDNRVRYWHQVTTPVVEGYRRWLDARDYAGRTLYLELTTLKQAVKWMAREGLVPASHAVAARLRKVHGTNTYCYTPEEARAIVAFCRGSDALGWLADAVVALAATGLRVGELAALRWADIDLGRGVIHLRDQTRRSRRSERAAARTTKSHRDRSLAIHDNLMAVLRRLHRGDDGRVFRGPRGGRLKPDTVRTVLQRDVLAALSGRFPGADGRPGIAAGRVHSFRHYFASAAAGAGVPEQVLMDWLGHRESRMIRHYYHLRQDEGRRQMGKLPPLDPGGPEGG